jgi:flagellar P-ring protein precursor FlgI
MRLLAALLAAIGLIAAAPSHAQGVRVKDLGKIYGWRENALIGYGVVTGLAGTGDSPVNQTTRQTISNLLSQFDLVVTPAQIQSRNVAVAMVTASLPPFARPGDTLDVTVTSLGDARSLVGGALMLTPLKAPNGRVYALAQGPLSVGGYKYDLTGNVVQKNHPTVASIPAGGVVEVGVTTDVVDPKQQMVTFVLSDADYTTATRIANAVNVAFGADIAEARDASGVEIKVTDDQRAHLPLFITKVESLAIDPDRRARVVINERTGTVVSGGDVRISPVAISHGDLKVSIVTVNTASQPQFISGFNPGVQTAIVSNTRIDIEEKGETGLVTASNNTVADLVQALTRIKTNTRDIISILRAVKAAGALYADLIIQ